MTTESRLAAAAALRDLNNAFVMHDADTDLLDRITLMIRTISAELRGAWLGQTPMCTRGEREKGAGKGPGDRSPAGAGAGNGRGPGDSERGEPGRGASGESGREADLSLP